MRTLFRSKNLIEDEANNLKAEADKVLQDQDKVHECCEDLGEALRDIFPECIAYPFGSRICGIGNSVSLVRCFVKVTSFELTEKRFGRLHGFG